MLRKDPPLKPLLLALAIAAGTYGSLWLKVLLAGVPDLFDFCFGTALIFLGAIVAQRAMRMLETSNPYRRALVLCRRLPLWQGCSCAAGILALFLLFDRFLDGDPNQFRLFSFVAPILISAVLFDLRPGLFAVALSSLAVELFIVPPLQAYGFRLGSDFVGLALFFALTALLSLGLQRLINANKRKAGLSTGLPRQENGVSPDLYRMFEIPRPEKTKV